MKYFLVLCSYLLISHFKTFCTKKCKIIFTAWCKIDLLISIYFRKNPVLIMILQKQCITLFTIKQAKKFSFTIKQKIVLRTVKIVKSGKTSHKLQEKVVIQNGLKFLYLADDKMSYREQSCKTTCFDDMRLRGS